MDNQLKLRDIQAFDATRLQWPTDWDSVFQRTAPVYLEIGFGNGQFLVDLALQNRDANVLGVEISLPSIKKAERKIVNQHLANCRVVHGDARLLLWSGVVPEKLDRVYINFPDPWHKAAHHHRKLINLKFLELLASRMVDGGILDIATDDPGYQDVITEALENTPYFNSRTGHTFSTEDNERIRTKYELKALAEGRTCQYYHWQRNQTSVENRYPIPQELNMPHAIISTSLTLKEIASRYEVKSLSGEIPVRLLHMFEKVAGDSNSEARPSLIVETHVAEDPLPQRIALTIQQRPDSELIIGLHELGFPRPTQGVHVAVGHVARFILELDRDAHVRHHNLNVELQRTSR